MHGDRIAKCGCNEEARAPSTGTPVFLSFNIGPNFSSSTLALYHFDGTSWTPYSAPDLSYDGTYANFTVTSFSGYALAAPTPTPEPTTLSLLALASLPLLTRRRHPSKS